MSVTTHASVEDFFLEVLTDALDRQGVAASPPTEFYLVGLLGEYTKARISDEPLSLKLVGTAGADAGERFRALKEVGDTSLYLAGFFAESLHRKLVGVEYYMDLGKAAYGELAQRLSTSSVREVYEELSGKFPRFVDVLAEIRSHTTFLGQDVVALYEEWMRTRSDWVEQRLRALGVLVSGPTEPEGGGLLQ
ncbi:MAG TPA: hypothetical protein VK698_08205 [Kofleriaceae bacterium]|nr:hypothetical protein [Kofleriaceae bacterium]